MKNRQTPDTAQGFTLIELMVTIALLAIMATLALPATGEIIARQRIASLAENVATTMNYARSEAIRLNKPVYVVPGAVRVDGKVNGPLSSGTWKKDAGAFVVYYNRDNTFGYNSATDEIARYSDFNSDKIGVALTTRTAVDLNSAGKNLDSGRLTFMPIGLMRVSEKFNEAGGEKIGQTARIVLQDKNRENLCRVVKIESAGRAVACTKKQTDEAASGEFCYCKEEVTF